MGDLSTNFSSREFACKDCGLCRISGVLILALEALRSSAGKPIKVLSGYRCPQHNQAVDGTGKSEHLLGMASDVVIEGLSVQQMYDYAAGVPEFLKGGIGVYDGGFIHVDVRPKQARWARVKGGYVKISELVKI